MWSMLDVSGCLEVFAKRFTGDVYFRITPLFTMGGWQCGLSMMSLLQKAMLMWGL